MSQKLVIRNYFSCRVSQIKKSNGHSVLKAVAYISARKLVNEHTGEEHNFDHKKGVIEIGFLLPENVKSKVSDADFFQHLENNCHASTNTTAYSAIMALPTELNIDEQKKLVHEFCRFFTKTYNTAVSFAIHEPDNYKKKKATLKVIEQYNLPGDIEQLEKETRNNHVHLVMPYCEIEPLTEKDLTTRRKKKNIGDGFKLGKQVKDFNPIKYASEIKKEKPDLLNPKQKFIEFMREEWCDYINNKLKENNRIERYTHKSYKRLGLDIEVTTHEGEMIRNRVKNGAEMQVHSYNKTQKEKQLTQPDYLNFINRPIDAELAEKILSGDFKAEREAIEADPEKLVRDCISAQSLINQLLKNRQLKREQEAEDLKREEIENIYSEFIELQTEYSKFAKTFTELEKVADREQAKTLKDFEKSEKWVEKLIQSKAIYRHQNDLFYDNYHHNYLNIPKPNFYLTEKEKNKKDDQVYEKFKQDVFELAQQLQIENIIDLLKPKAAFLTENNVELPVQKQNLWKKVKGEKVHSFDTISDFEKAKDFIDERKNDILKSRKDYENNQLEARKCTILEEHAKQQSEQLRLEIERSNTLERENQLRFEKTYEDDPKQTRKSETNNDNDFSM